jgi:hypothetical protein
MTIPLCIIPIFSDLYHLPTYAPTYTTVLAQLLVFLIDCTLSLQNDTVVSQDAEFTVHAFNRL